MRRHITAVVNPAAGHGRALHQAPLVREALNSIPDADARVVVSRNPADAMAQASHAIAQGRELVVMGGDGMASIGLNAAAGSGLPLGVLPAGTGNDFCRGTGLPSKLEDALGVVVAGHSRVIDLMSVTGDLVDGTSQRYAGSVLSTGYDERVNWRANNAKVDLGRAAYALALFSELRDFVPLHYRLVIDGEPRELDAILVAVGNAGVIGGGIQILPDAEVDDGLLDVTIVHPLNRSIMFRVFRQLFHGGIREVPEVEMVRARHIEVDGDRLFGMADGEDMGAVPLTCDVVPGSLRLFSPDTASA